MKSLKKALIALLAVCLLFGSVSLAAATPSPAPAQTMVPEKVDGTVTGTVIHVEENDIVINMDNGNTVLFMLNYLHVTDAAVGDKVSIEYSGDVLDAPEAITVTVTDPAQDAMTLSGLVMAFDETRMFVSISSGNVFGFSMDKQTLVSGQAAALTEGDQVTVTYIGSLDAIPYAKGIEIITPAKDVKNADTVNKTLDGYVRKLTGSKITIHTNSGKIYSFKLTGDTKTMGSYALEVGAKVRVTYEGKASKTPPAKIVKVLAPPDPTPPSPKYHTTSGTVENFYGVFLTLTNGNGFNCAGASYSGNSEGVEGDKAKVTYYIGDDGVYYATKVVFTSVDYDPIIDPVPAPDPEPEPEPDPIFGLEE